MPLTKLRGGSGHQTSRGAKGMREISSKDTTKRDNLANKISLRIKNLRQAGLKAHFKAIPKELRNRQQVKMQIRNQRNVLENKTLVNPNGFMRDHLTFAIFLNVMYSLQVTGSRLENHFELPIMWRK